jgi:plastocyanin
MMTITRLAPALGHNRVMPTQCMKILFAFCLLTGSALAPAAISIVNVGGSTQVFTPKTVTIHVGDTVKFVNKGGVHNVVADDGSFRCAHGCDGDGQGGNGGASGSNWVVTLTFTQVGTVGYFCETHGMPGGGMFGTIKVLVNTPVRLQSFVVD